MTDFGANEWLVDEMHDRYLEDPDSVDEAWRELFADRDNAGTDGRKAKTEPAAKPGPRPGATTSASSGNGNRNGTAPPAGAKPASRPEAETPRTATPPASK
jgi:2-oxoglutarate decarboxylase